NYTQTAPVVDRGDMVTTKIEHKLSDRVSLTGTYLFNNTNEPSPLFWGSRNVADPGQGILHRKIHIIALNNTIVISPNSVATLRYGWTRYDDNTEPFGHVDLASLDVPPTLIDDLTYDAVPHGH